MSRPLAVLVPTRGRPHAVDRLATAFHDTSDGHALLTLIVDRDEAEAYLEAVEALNLDDESWFDLVLQTPARLAPSINKWGPWAARAHRHVGFIGDDHIPRTKGWDTAVVDALDHLGTGVVYTNDLIHGPNLATAMFYTGTIVRALGRMTPPGMTHLFLDNAAMDLGRALGALTYLPHTVIEHMHPIAGKGVTDATYEAANAPGVWEADRVKYDLWRASADGLAQDVRTIWERTT